MSDLTVEGTSTWKSGTPDTGTVVSDGPPGVGTPGQSAQINGLLQFAKDLQAILGNAPSLKGSVADLATRLALVLAANGAIANGSTFPSSPVNAQIFYRTDLQGFYFYNAVTGQWKLGFDNSQYVLVDGTRFFTGGPQVQALIPFLRLVGLEVGAADFRIKEDTGTLKTQINVGSLAAPIWNDDNFFVPTGGGIDFFPSIIPGGWLQRDGSAVSRTTYARLFAAIGTTFGPGDGATTFNVPDDRGRVTVCDGQGAGLTLRVLGVTGGEEAHALTGAETGPHQHQEQYTTDNINSGPTPAFLCGVGGFVQGNPSIFLQADPNQLFPAGPLNTLAAGNGTPHNTMQPFLVCKKIIKT